jgi:16S rRNA (adenine1518-N6/adenine1519-N6)-dimethyltransferase
MPYSSDDAKLPSTSSGKTSPRKLLAARDLRPKKKFGQNFLMDAAAARRIAELCVTQRDDLVVEVGPGTGSLTQALLAVGGRVIAVEIDTELVGVLRGRADLAAAAFIEADALVFDFEQAAQGRRWCASGNLPYNIATPLILRWLESPAPPERIVVMVQREVAERFTAAPATPAYGSLSIAVQYAMHVRPAFTLGPQAFHPKPKVDSAVVVMERREHPAVTVRDRALFLKVVRAAFAYRRKTLANSLSLALGIERPRTQLALTHLGYDMEIRGEQLDMEAFGVLADTLV